MDRGKQRALGRRGRNAAPDAAVHLFATAVRHHQAGRLAQAQDCYQQALAFDPRHAPSLHYLGVLAHQTGHDAAAADLIGKAIALERDNPESHYNITLPLRALGRLDDVIAHCRRAIALKADHAQAHLNLGNALRARGELAQAIGCYQTVLRLRPDAAEAHFNLANMHAERGMADEAIAGYERTLALRPDHAQAHNNLGTALMAQGRAAEAVARFQQAVACDPGLAEAYINLGGALLRYGKLHDALGVINRAFEIGVAQGKAGQALDLVRRAIEIEENADTRTLFVQCVRSLTAVPDLDYVRAFMLRALAEPWGRPVDLAPAATSLIRHNAIIRACIDRAASAWPRRLSGEELFGIEGRGAVMRDRLLRTLLESTAIRDIALERFLTNARAVLLDAVGETWDEDTLSFGCALARHCFINEYAFDCTADEALRVAQLRDAVAAAAQAGTPVAGERIAAIAAYGPLHESFGPEVRGRGPSTPVEALIDVQVRGSREEQRIAETIPALTGIADEVSLKVREQYEQNPYPRWVKTAPIGAPVRLDDYLSAKFPGTGYKPLNKPAIDVLVAGCGTGQHSATVALQFLDAQILAIDLSRASLAYAQRTTRALGLAAIDYAQADILKLGSLDRGFDLIDSSGVLHHLADPFAGWRILLSRLRPGGVMRLGFYSTLGRSDVDAVRRYVCERGYRATPEDIRRCRQDLMSFADGTPQKIIAETSDFFSLSECRDLLFHVQERSLTLPEIKDFLAANALAFLGFEGAPAGRQLYARRFPGDRAMTDLDRWHAVETEAPRTFFNMYQFWIQKPD